MKTKLPLASDVLTNSDMVLVQNRIMFNIDTLSKQLPITLSRTSLSLFELETISNSIEYLLNDVNHVLENYTEETDKLASDTSVDC